MWWGVNDYPSPPDYTVPTCPVCGQETDTLYSDIYGEIVGCDMCIKLVDAWDWREYHEHV